MNSEEVEARSAAARHIVSDLCHRRREWIMSIPARPDYDPDLVIANSLKDIDNLLYENAFLREWLRGELTLADVDIDQAIEDAKQSDKKR